MFDENENLVAEATENTEQQTVEENVEEATLEEATEEVQPEEVVEEPKEELFTKEQVDEMLAKKLSRKTNKIRDDIRKEYEKKYSKLETVVNVGLGTNNIEEATQKLTDFYEKKGIKIPEEPKYSERDIEVLANAEAEDIISNGDFKELEDEVDRLAEIGLDKMDQREKILFKRLAEERQRVNDEKALTSIGVSKDSINDAEFKEFAEKLNPNLSTKEKYEMYLKFKPKPKVEQIGSMKNGQPNKVKDHYTAEEIKLLTDEDLANEEVWNAVRRSMTGK